MGHPKETSQELPVAPEGKGIFGRIRGLIRSGRMAVAPVVLYIGLSMVACGSPENHNTDGGDGDADIEDVDTPDGDGGEEDVDEGDTGEEDGGEHPCPFDPKDYFATLTLEKGQGGTLEVTDPQFPFRGAKVQVPPVSGKTILAVTTAIGVDVPLPGNGKYAYLPGQTEGLELLALNGENPVDPETCLPVETENPCAEEACELFVPEYSTVLYLAQDSGKEEGAWVIPGEDHSSTLTPEGTVAMLPHFSPFYPVNGKPEVKAEAEAVEEGYVEIDLSGSSANGSGEDYAFSEFVFTEGETEIEMEPVEEGGLVFRSTGPLSAGEHVIRVEARGRNFTALPEQDKAEKTVEVNVEQPGLCEGNTCDNGKFCDGEETCDPENGDCVAGVAPCEAPLMCDEEKGACVGCLGDSDCSQEDFCAPQTCENNICTPEARDCGEGVCDETRDRCAQCIGNAQCPDDGNACNGPEQCDTEEGVCESADAVLCPDDGNVCNGAETCNPANGQCVSVNPLACPPDDGKACNGQEICDPQEGCKTVNVPSCPSGTSCAEPNGDCIPDDLCADKNYDDNNVCNGLETCDPLTGNKVDGTPLNCNDNNACNGIETCNPSSGCQPGTPLDCDNGQYCDGQETCNTQTGCQSGTAPNCNMGTCNEAADKCDCSPGYAGANCNQCAPEREPDYPACSPDVTPPAAPVITTGGGENFIIHQDNFIIEGTCSSDTYSMWVKVDDGDEEQLPFTPYSGNWVYNGYNPNIFTGHTYCFIAKDYAGNVSEEDCNNVGREP